MGVKRYEIVYFPTLIKLLKILIFAKDDPVIEVGVQLEDETSDIPAAGFVAKIKIETAALFFTKNIPTETCLLKRLLTFNVYGESFDPRFGGAPDGYVINVEYEVFFWRGSVEARPR